MSDLISANGKLLLHVMLHKKQDLNCYYVITKLLNPLFHRRELKNKKIDKKQKQNRERKDKTEVI